MDPNQEVFDGAVGDFTELALMPAERAVLGRLRGRLAELEMLDLGVGSGRTGYTFAALVARYVGLDYSPRMIAAARELLGPGAELVVGNARDLSVVDGEFDFVLFSFNGIDASSPDDRLTILSQVRSRLRDDGCFLFSSHNLGALPFDRRRPHSARFAGSKLYRLYAIAADLDYARRVRQLNREIDLGQARRRGWTVVRSMAHGFRIRDYYVDPELQLRQLRDAGFAVDAVFDPDGREVELPHRGRQPWLDYLCRPLAAA